MPPRQDDPFREAWRAMRADHPDTRTGRYYPHKELFDSLPGELDENRSQQLVDWHSYLENIVLTNPDYQRRDPRNPFWSQVALHPNDFSWAEWREAMGYPRRK